MDDFHRLTPSGKLRARGLGVPFDGTPGRYNAVTDVAGVEVGYCTIVRGEGAAAVRTGVTALLPRGRSGVQTPVFAAYFSLNGNGELTGAHWVEESGQCEGPVTLTNTHACGLARDATVRWMLNAAPGSITQWGLPVAGETYDGDLNDINGFRVTDAHVFEALDTAHAGPLELGSVGGGTGMICYGFKGGSGSASRTVRTAQGDYIVGLFVQANFGSKDELRIAGIPVGPRLPGRDARARPGGSIIALLVTDAPLLPHQLKRLARRIPLGMARTGSVSHNGSGDIFLACSTANADVWSGDTPPTARLLPNDALDPLFAAVVEGIEEAVIDAIVPNETMVGRNDLTAEAIPGEALRDILRAHNCLLT